MTGPKIKMTVPQGLNPGNVVAIALMVQEIDFEVEHNKPQVTFVLADTRRHRKFVQSVEATVGSSYPVHIEYLSGYEDRDE